MSKTKLIIVNDVVTVVLSDGTTLTQANASDEFITQVQAAKSNEEELTALFVPNYVEAAKKYKTAKVLKDNLEDSSILTLRGQSIYILDISELSLPMDLAVAIYKAEQEGDKDTLTSYLNFWTLCSLNPDSRARTNMFWFLTKYGLKISKSGLFVAYRAVCVKEGSTKARGYKNDKDVTYSKSTTSVGTEFAKFISEEYFRVKAKLKKSPKNYFVGKDDNGKFVVATDTSKLKDAIKENLGELYSGLSGKVDTSVTKEVPDVVFTDERTKSFDIRLGVPVTMDRAACDTNQNNTCSRGLHVASKEWLRDNNHFGDVKLMVLVNPAEVVAVPPLDSYGKMRTCAYYPVKIVNLDDLMEDDEIPDGFEDDFVSSITYTGDINNKEEGGYHINIPDIPEINSSKISKRLDELKASIKKC